MNFHINKNKYNAVATFRYGIRFDSKAELEYYEYLKTNPEVIHVDVHVPVTLTGGIRYNIDFLVYKKTKDEETGRISAHEYKGKPTADFVRMRKLFDETHPLSPLKVVTKKGKHFIEI